VRSFYILKRVLNIINTVIDRVERTTLKAYNCEKRAKSCLPEITYKAVSQIKSLMSRILLF